MMTEDNAVQAYPLTWPTGWRRAKNRKRAAFGSKVVNTTYGYSTKGQLSVSQSIARVLDEFGRMGVGDWNVVISTNVALRNDGLPRSGQREPIDPGAAVYWRKGDESRCMAVDRYDRVADNLAAIAATLSAMRAIERHGGAEILDRAFTGFVALPSPEQWFQVLGVSHDATHDEIEQAYRRQAMSLHPDRGGDADKMARLNRARTIGHESKGKAHV